MDYGLQELCEQMKITVTSRIPGFIFTNAEDRTKFFFFCMLDKIIRNRTYTAKCRRSKFNIPRWIFNCRDGYWSIIGSSVVWFENVPFFSCCFPISLIRQSPAEVLVLWIWVSSKAVQAWHWDSLCLALKSKLTPIVCVYSTKSSYHCISRLLFVPSTAWVVL